MEHVNITIPEDLKSILDSEAKKQNMGRSTFIQKAVAFYLELLKKKQTGELLAEGYNEMAPEARKISYRFNSLDNDLLKDVD